MVLENHVVLQNGTPTRMHFTDHRVEARPITERQTGRPAIRNVLVLDVDQLDGRPVHALFSTMAEKLAARFSPYLADKGYRGYDFVVTQNGDGWTRDWTTRWIPRT